MASIKVMSSNLWGDYFKNPVELRYRGLFQVYEKHCPDILFLQEATPAWWDILPKQALLTAVNPETDGRNNYVPLFYSKKRLELIDCGFLLYHEKLDKTKGITWAVLKDKFTMNVMLAASTHFWWQTGVIHDYVRTVNARDLSQALEALGKKYSCSVLAGGDLNCLYSSDVFEILKSHGFDSAQFSLPGADQTGTEHGDPVLGDDGLYHGKKADVSCEDISIDHILFKPNESRIKNFKVIVDQEALDSTDHSPILAEFEL